MGNTIGVVVLDLDQETLTRRCLLSLVKGHRLPDMVVIVENGSEMQVELGAEFCGQVKIRKLRPGRNLGCAGGRNLGLDYLIGNAHLDILMVLDNDTIVPPDFVEKVHTLLLRPLEVVAPTVLDFATGKIWSCGGRASRDRSIEQLKIAPEDKHHFDVDWAPGACLIARSETWKAMGGFDPWLQFLFEDIDWCIRVRRKGGRIVVRKDLTLVHEPHQSLGGQWSPTRVYFWARNVTVFRLAVIRCGMFNNLRWVCREILLVFRDVLVSRAPWSKARLVGLAVGLTEGFRRKIGRVSRAS